jgi:hypothetical protein
VVPHLRTHSLDCSIRGDSDCLDVDANEVVSNFHPTRNIKICP